MRIVQEFLKIIIKKTHVRGVQHEQNCFCSLNMQIDKVLVAVICYKLPFVGEFEQ